MFNLLNDVQNEYIPLLEDINSKAVGTKKKQEVKCRVTKYG